MKWDYFISYPGDREPVARRLYELLASNNQRAFYAPRSVRPGEDWHRCVVEALMSSRNFVLLVPEYPKAGFFQREEVLVAIRLVKSHPNRHCLIPVYLDSEEPGEGECLFPVQGFQGLSLQGGETLETLVDRILGNKPTAPTAAEQVCALERLILRREEVSDRRETQAVADLTVEIEELARRIRRRPSLQPGSVVCRAKLERILGRGSFATVWLARDVSDGGLRAVKVFDLDNLTQRLMTWRFRRGVIAMQRLCERRDVPPGLVRIHEVAEDRLAFSMDYAPGGNLERMDRKSWSVERKMDLFLQVCWAVDFSHGAGVIHRDIKPGNIVLNGKEGVWLTDFDIADVQFVTTLSLSSGGLGTPVFAAPEQLADERNATAASDIYSLGRLLYFMLLERSPGIQIEPDPQLRDISAYPPSLVAIVRRATQHDPRSRYGSVRELISDVEQYQTGKAALRAQAMRASRWFRQNRPGLAVASLVLGSSLGLAWYQGYNRNVLSSLNSQLIAKHSELLGYVDEIAHKNEELDDQSDTLRRYTEELSRQERRLGAFSVVVQNKDRLLRQHAEDLHERAVQARSYSAELSRSEGQLAVLSRELSGCAEQFEELSDNRYALQERITGLQTQVSKLREVLHREGVRPDERFATRVLMQHKLALLDRAMAAQSSIPAETRPSEGSKETVAREKGATNPSCPIPGRRLVAPPVSGPRQIVEPYVLPSTRSTPRYPELARRARAEGRVEIRVTVCTDGTPCALCFARSPGGKLGFEEAVTEVVRQWRYQPGLVDGVPTAMYHYVSFPFYLDGAGRQLDESR